MENSQLSSQPPTHPVSAKHDLFKLSKRTQFLPPMYFFLVCLLYYSQRALHFVWHFWSPTVWRLFPPTSNSLWHRVSYWVSSRISSWVSYSLTCVWLSLPRKHQIPWLKAQFHKSAPPPHIHMHIIQTQITRPGYHYLSLSLTITQLKLEVPMTPSLSSISLLEQLTELREAFMLTSLLKDMIRI